jgi:hypothetical protein
MNELEARRRLLADPHHVPPELASAIAHDASLAALREELLANDARLNRALTSPPVPEGLADRLVLRARHGKRRQWGFALAAAAAALAIGLPAHLRLAERERALEIARDEAMLEHVVHSADELGDDGHVEPAVLRASVASLGVTLRAPRWRVRHLANCVIAGIESRHFIIESPHGPVTYVVLPGAVGDAALRTLESDGVRGVFTRRAGATVAVFASNATSREDLERMMRDVLG